MRVLALYLLPLFFSITALAQIQGLTIQGDPVSGAVWTYQATDGGVTYDLEGILFKPSGNGPFPAVIINHGTGFTVHEYSRAIAEEMVTWGYVCIGTNYTHTGVPPCGSPGKCDNSDFGASEANIQRAVKCLDILSSLSYVDTNCIKAFGHSRGAFVTTALVATHPRRFSSAGHTSGGVSLTSGDSAPSEQLASQILCPYIIHHAREDFLVPFEADASLNRTLNDAGTINTLYSYDNAGHDDLLNNPTVMERTRSWFEQYKCGLITDTEETVSGGIKVYPIPAKSSVNIKVGTEGKNISVVAFDITGKQITIQLNDDADGLNVDLSDNRPGVYILHIYIDEEVIIKKIILEP